MIHVSECSHRCKRFCCVWKSCSKHLFPAGLTALHHMGCTGTAMQLVFHKLMLPYIPTKHEKRGEEDKFIKLNQIEHLMILVL